ncbi:MAG: electron transfer flavoprotein subunit beta/FixA family protein [Clostridia bacterium]|jgi:electron transfer flavoprotein beta subunit|nr:electron transfer flavoprotein subunit beta/FixA family protein [Clostridia bacterium]MBT7121637.1 electron transfer flavoprotein subunit beta/FixA family protein [Clostridia bacterium]
MKIAVCIKQVPGTMQVDIDPDTGVLQRAGISAKMNPYDLYALETALRLKQQVGAHVTAITMGPPQAQAIIKEAYMMGADEGVILSDTRFAGADVLATSYTLAGGLSKLGGFDLIICGKQTTDGDTAQVGPAIAEHLNIPHVAWVKTIEHMEEKSIVVEQNMEDSLEVVRMSYPCLISVEKDIYTPRLPSYLNKKKTRNKQISVLTLDDLSDQSEENYGLSGSPTQVERVFSPQPRDDHTTWDCEQVDGAELLYDLLATEKFI